MGLHDGRSAAGQSVCSTFFFLLLQRPRVFICFSSPQAQYEHKVSSAISLLSGAELIDVTLLSQPTHFKLLYSKVLAHTHKYISNTQASSPPPPQHGSHLAPPALSANRNPGRRHCVAPTIPTLSPADATALRGTQQWVFEVGAAVGDHAVAAAVHGDSAAKEPLWVLAHYVPPDLDRQLHGYGNGPYGGPLWEEPCSDDWWCLSDYRGESRAKRVMMMRERRGKRRGKRRRRKRRKRERKIMRGMLRRVGTDAGTTGCGPDTV